MVAHSDLQFLGKGAHPLLFPCAEADPEPEEDPELGDDVDFPGIVNINMAIIKKKHIM